MPSKQNSPKHNIQPYYDFLNTLEKYQKIQYMTYKQHLNFHKMTECHYSSTYSHYNNFCEDKNVQNYLKWQKEHEAHIEINKSDKIKVHRATKKEIITLAVNVKTLDDLIDIIEKNKFDSSKEYNIDLESMHKILPELKQLQSMIGLSELKTSILQQLLYFIQGFTQSSTGDYKHTVLTGPPGTGKTELAKIIGGIYSKVGILKNKVFKKVTRTDLVAGYLGQTAIKTRKKIDECIGGVLFIDEAYSLQPDDMYAKECVDTLCEALSDHKNDLMVIIAGYEKELNERFFKINDGLPSRFVWRFNVDSYDGNELYQIFARMIKLNDWKMDDNITEKWFQDKKDSFISNGRSIEQILLMSKISHSSRIFGKSSDLKKIITLEDLSKGFELYKQNIKTSKDNIFLGLYT